jgi:hypothetical protein
MKPRGTPMAACIAFAESSRPSRYSSSNSGERGSGMFSTTCRRIHADPGVGGSQRTSRSGAGGRAVIGQAWSSQQRPSATAHSMSWGTPSFTRSTRSASPDRSRSSENGSACSVRCGSATSCTAPSAGTTIDSLTPIENSVTPRLGLLST